MQGFNMGRYVPPDLEGTTTANSASGKGHALGSRARKLASSGVLIVRFECPFAIWCTHCQPEQIIGQGVRFNAEKKKVGAYYSTPIWSFRIKHTVCGKHLEVRTDPKNAEYVVVEGGRRRDTGADKLLDGEVRIGATEEEKARLEKDGGFGMLEKKLEDKREAVTLTKRVEELAKRSERDWADPYEKSRLLRREFRVGRRQRQADEKSGEALQDKFGLGMDMLAPNKDDSERAAFVDFGEVKSGNSSSKPMFADNSATPSIALDRNHGKREKKDISYSRDMLQKTVKGNTRNTLDPFLADPQQGRRWRPQVKRQRIDSSHSMNDVRRDETEHKTGPAQGIGLVGYESDSDSL